MDDIFELAKAKALIGGGGKRTGTAIPADAVVDRIYFNTNNTREETYALLSQLTYIEGVTEYPVALIYACCDETYTGDFIYALKIQHPAYGYAYMINYARNLVAVNGCTLFGYISNDAFENGWSKTREYLIQDSGTAILGAQFLELTKTGQPLLDLQGLPIGTENEKIKNVLSVTPF